MPRKPHPPADAPTEHVPGQEAFPTMEGLGQPSDDMTPQRIHLAPNPDPGMAPDQPQEPQQATQEPSNVTIQVTGRPTPANVLTTVLGLVTTAMLADGWDVTAVSAAIHDQVDATMPIQDQPHRLRFQAGPRG